jgi:hypothetical protein
MVCLPVVHTSLVQEANTAGTLAMLSGLGVAGAADTRLQLHSVLAGGKRRVTAEFSQAGQTAALKLQKVSGCWKVSAGFTYIIARLPAMTLAEKAAVLPSCQCRQLSCSAHSNMRLWAL